MCEPSRRDVHVDKSGALIVQKPSMAKNFSSSRAPKKWRITPDDLEEHENRCKIAASPHQPSIAIHTAISAAWSQGRPQQRRTASAAPPSRKLNNLHDFVHDLWHDATICSIFDSSFAAPGSNSRRHHPNLHHRRQVASLT